MLSVHTSPLATLGGKETGGMNVYVRELSREWSRQGIYVDVYTRAQEAAGPRVRELAEQSRVFYVKAGPEQPYNKNYLYRHLDEFAAGVKAYNYRYDFIFSHYWLSGIVADALRRAWDVPFAQMFHTLAALKNQVAHSSEREPRRRINCEGEVMRMADRIIAATPDDREQMVALYSAPREKVRVVPPGVDLNRFRPLGRVQAKRQVGVLPHREMILFVGRIQPLKGIDTLIRALALVHQQEPTLAENLCVAIIGGHSHQDGAELERLKALGSDLGLKGLVTFLGATDQDWLASYYSAATMVVMPSHYESFGMVAIEAMACGTPVIASDVGGLSFIVADGHNGYLVPGRDPQALAAKIILLLKYPALRDQLGRQAQAWAERYSWSSIAGKLLEVFAEAQGEYYGGKNL
jgi:D-inositol-3-phosphate glycosyltransferase